MFHEIAPRRPAAFLAGVVIAAACCAFISYNPDGQAFVLFETRAVKWLAIAIAGAFAAVATAIGRDVRPPTLLTSVDAACIALLGWAAISGSWAPDRLAFGFSVLHICVAASLYVWVRFLGEAAIGSLLQGIAVAAIPLLLLLAALDLPDTLRTGFGNVNFTAEFATAAVVLAGALAVVARLEGLNYEAAVYGVVALLGALYLVIISPTNLQFLGFASALLFASWWVSKRVFLALLLAGLAGFVVLLALAPDYGAALPITFRDRAQIWVNSASLAAQSPLLGQGLGSFYHEYPTVLEEHLRLAPFLGTPAFDNFLRNAPAAENEYLQILTELGAVGLLLALAVLLAFCWSLFGSRPNFLAAACGVALASVLGMAFVSFPLQNPAPAALAAILLAAVSSTQDPGSSASLWQLRRLTVAHLLLSVVLAALLLPTVRASVSFAKADAYDAQKAYAAAADSDPPDT